GNPFAQWRWWTCPRLSAQRAADGWEDHHRLLLPGCLKQRALHRRHDLGPTASGPQPAQVMGTGRVLLPRFVPVATRVVRNVTSGSRIRCPHLTEAPHPLRGSSYGGHAVCSFFFFVLASLGVSRGPIGWSLCSSSMTLFREEQRNATKVPRCNLLVGGRIGAVHRLACRSPAGKGGSLDGSAVHHEGVQ